MRRLLAGLLLFWPLAALATPFDGLYRPNYDWAERWDCETVGTDGGAMQIAGETMTGIGTSCTLSDPVEVRGMDGVLYDLACAGVEGAPRAIILRHEFGVYVVTDGLVLDWLSCE